MQILNHLNQILSELPKSPGIYKFYDVKNRLLYIGKSKNLKNRVRTYFHKQSSKTKERTLIMINNIADIKIAKTATELEALILEDTLIKQHLPPYNVKQKKFRSQVYLAVTADEFPALKIIAQNEIHLTDQIFGTFKDKFAAEKILYVLQKTLKLRKCTEPIPNGKCMLAGIDQCLGPCLGKITPEQYKQKLDIAIDFLKGSFAAISNTIAEQISKSASDLDFEEAAKLRDLQEFCIYFCKRQEFIQDFIHKNITIQKGKFSFIFQKGELIKVYKKKVSNLNFRNHLDKNIPNDNAVLTYLMDRAYVVWAWLKQNQAKYQIIK